MRDCTRFYPRVEDMALAISGFKIGPFIAAALLLASPGARSEPAPDALNQAFQLSLGTFIMNGDIEVRLDAETEEGTLVDWERTFGDQNANRFRIDGQWRFADRHKLRFLWFNYSRSASWVSDHEIEWGDEIVPISAQVGGEFKFDVYELAYEYSFMRRETWELAANIGLHYTDLSLGISAEVDSQGHDLNERIDEDASLAAPLPVIGLRATWQLPYNLLLDASGQYFAAAIDQYDGSLQDYRILLTWQPMKWVGVGVGFDRFSVNLNLDKPDFDGKLKWVYQGPMVYYSVVF